MNRWLRRGLFAIGVALVVILVGYALFTRQQAKNFMTNSPEEVQQRIDRERLEGRFYMDPGELNLPYEDVTVTNASGMELNGWYIPSQNGAVVMLQHGFAELPYHMLEEAEMLYRHGYGSLLTSVRAHNFSDGETVTFGCSETEDMEAWYQHLLTRDDVDPDKIAVLGQSMGGMIVIKYASENENIQAVVAHSAFSSTPDVLVVGISHFFPAVPDWFIDVFANTLVFWMEREVDCDVESLSPKDWVKDLDGRPVYVIDAELDEVVNRDAGELIFEAAGEPKEFWQCAGSLHHECDTDYPAEFEERVVGFFDRYLLAQ